MQNPRDDLIDISSTDMEKARELLREATTSTEATQVVEEEVSPDLSALRPNQIPPALLERIQRMMNTKSARAVELRKRKDKRRSAKRAAKQSKRQNRKK